MVMCDGCTRADPIRDAPALDWMVQSRIQSRNFEHSRLPRRSAVSWRSAAAVDKAAAQSVPPSLTDSAVHLLCRDSYHNSHARVEEEARSRSGPKGGRGKGSGGHGYNIVVRINGTQGQFAGRRRTKGQDGRRQWNWRRQEAIAGRNSNSKR